jgi:hypothetical protein
MVMKAPPRGLLVTLHLIILGLIHYIYISSSVYGVRGGPNN